MSASKTDFLILVVLSIFWSTSYVAIEFALEGFTPLWMTTSRLLLASLFLLIIVKFKRESLPTDPKTWWLLAWVGISGMTIPFLLIGWAQIHITASKSAIIVSTTPIATMLLSHFLTQDHKITPRMAIGLFLGFVGVFNLIGGWQVLKQPSSGLPELAALGGAFGYAVSSVLMKRLSHLTPTVTAAGFSLIAFILIFPIAIYLEPLETVNPTPDSLIGLFYLVIFSTVIGVILMAGLIYRVSPSFMSLNNYLIPAFAAIWGILLLNETVSADMIVALILILSGVAIAGRAPRPRVPR